MCVYERFKSGESTLLDLGFEGGGLTLLGPKGEGGVTSLGEGTSREGIRPGPVVEGDRVRHCSLSSTHYKMQFSPSYSLRIYAYSSLFLPLQSHTYHIIRVLSFRSPISFYSSYSLVFSRCNLISLLFAFSLFLPLYFSPSLSFFFDFIKWVLLR